MNKEKSAEIWRKIQEAGDFLKNKGWLKSKEAGKMRLEGKDYIVNDGDVLNFRFNT